MGDIVIESDDWTLDLGSGQTSGCSFPPLQTNLSLTIPRLSVGTSTIAPASLTVRRGRLHNTFVVHITPDGSPGAFGAVIVEGPEARWDVDAYVDLGWVAHGRVVVREGAEMTAGAIFAGIRDDALGELEITGGGIVGLNHLDIGFGHESTGEARGYLLVSDRSSLLTITNGFLSVGGVSHGTVDIQRQGVVQLVESSARISAPTDGITPSAVTVADFGSEWSISHNLTVGDNGTLTVTRGGLVAVGSVLEVTLGGTINVGSGGLITVGDCSAIPGRRRNVILVCPGGTLITNGTINGRVVQW